MRTPLTSIRSAIVTRRHGGERSVALSPAATAASEQIASTRSIMSW